MKKSKNFLSLISMSFISGVPLLFSFSATSNIKTKKTFENKSFINKPRNIRDFEKNIEELNTSSRKTGWQAKYKKIKWDNVYDAKMHWSYAKKYGWNSLQDYEMYLRYVYETNYGKINNEFGYFNKDNANWVAWHNSSGMVLHDSYEDGIFSPTKPTWEGSENVKYNNIDNNKKWFAYDQGGFFFIFNEDHISDAWKRLLYIKRIVPAPYNKILKEADKSGQNYFMINGSLVKKSELDKYQNYYYITTDGEKDYIKDSNNWKVLVTDEDLNIIYKNINPDSETKDTLSAKHYLMSDRFLNEYKLIKYPVDSTKNNDSKDPIKSEDITRQGKYQITYKYDSYKDLVADNHLIKPHGSYSSWDMKDKYGESVQSSPYSHAWAYGGYMFMWVEDGKGGHKIWKSLKNLNKKVRDNNDGRFLMYANWHHAFPVKGKKWFQSISEIYDDSHIK